jgi:hypothetical protein
MNWIKVEPNPADNDAHPERLPALDKVVHIILMPNEQGYDHCRLMALGERVDGEDGWLWAIHDSDVYERGGEGDLMADDEYHVIYWAEIEWPEL